MARDKYFPFYWIIVSCGVLTLLVILGNFSILGFHRHHAGQALFIADADPTRAKDAFHKYGCGGCHVIPGIPTANGRVGPKLEDFAMQTYIGGVLANTPANLIAWIKDPRIASPKTAMPNLNVTEDEARDMAAYLYRQ